MVMPVLYGTCHYCGKYYCDCLAHEHYCKDRPPVVGFWNKVLDWFKKPGGNFT